MMQRDVLMRILEKAILAPSGDNSQPWRFRIFPEKGRLELSIVDMQKTGWLFEVGNKSCYFSAGTVIENLRVAASREGMRLNVTYLCRPTEPLKVAVLDFERVPIQTSDHYPFVKERHTNRAFYHPFRRISEASKEALDKIGGSNAGVRTIWIEKNSPKYGESQNLMAIADLLRFKIRSCHDAFMACLRFSRAEAESSRDGMPVEALGVGPLGGWLFKSISSWKTLRALNLFGFSYQFLIYLWIQLWTSQRIGIVVAPSESDIDCVKAGELSQRIWHEVTRQGLAFQPVDVIPVFSMTLRLHREDDFVLPPIKAQMQRLCENFSKKFGLSGTEIPAFAFRIGHAKPAKARTLRKPVEHFVIEADAHA